MKCAWVRILGLDRYESNSADTNVGLRYLELFAKKYDFIESRIFDPISIEEIEILISGQYDVIGFTTHYLNIEETIKATIKIKKYCKDSYVIYGGHHASACAEELLSDYPQINSVCIGDGEDVIDQLFENYNGTLPNGILRPRKFYDLNEIPLIPKYGSNLIERVSTSRGCPYMCTFCTTPALRRIVNEPTYRTLNADKVISQLELYAKEGVKKVYFNDDLFILPSKKSHLRAMSIADALIKKELNITYKTQLRIDSINHKTDIEFLQKLKSSGMKSVFIGVESGDDNILKEYKKNINVSQINEVLNLYRKVGIQVNSGNILASPDSTIESIIQSINTFKELNIAYLFFRRVTFKVHIFPGTTLEIRLEKQNRLENRPRYLPRNYEFKDKRLNEIIPLYEEVMPDYLNEFGYLFKLRDKILIKEFNHYNSIDNFKRVDKFKLWNKASSKFLLSGFQSKRIKNSEFKQWFLEYCDFSDKLGKDLKSMID